MVLVHNLDNDDECVRSMQKYRGTQVNPEISRGFAGKVAGRVSCPGGSAVIRRRFWIKFLFAFKYDAR